MKTNHLHVAFLGIGLMGKPMVENLLNAGFPMTLWNRTKAKAQAFSDRANIADSPAEAIKDADIIITMLENGPVVDEVIYSDGVIDSAPAGACFVDMSSIPPEMARKHAAICAQKGLQYADAPVSGGTVGAAQKTLSIMVGSEQDSFERCLPVLEAMGKATYIGKAGTGQLAKLSNQAIVGITIGAVSEALLLAAKGGANPVAVREALMGGFAGSKILELHGQRMIDRNFAPGARSRVQLKDLRTILDEARNQNLTLPLSQRVYDEYLALVASGNEGVDHSGLLLQLEALNQCNLADGKTED